MNVRFRSACPMPCLLSGLLACLASACDRADPCPHTSACPAPAVCEPDGTCRPAPPEPRPPEATHQVPALDWAIEHGDGTPAHQHALDLFPVGGPRDVIAHLTFGHLPPEAHNASQAVLSLFPHPSWHGARHPYRMLLLAGREPQEVRAQHRPPLQWTPEVTVVRARTGMGRALRIDATSLVQEAAGRGRNRVRVAVRLLHRRDETLRFASPRAQDPNLRPRIDLRLR